jgi:hypothetical protein
MKPSSGSTPVRGSSGSPRPATAPAAPTLRIPRTLTLPPAPSPIAPVPLVDEHFRRTPAAPLRPYVAWYAGYRQRAVPPARHRGLPSPFLTLIFTLDEPLMMLAHPDPEQPPAAFGALLGGLHCVPAMIVHQGAQSGVQLALRPLGVRLLLGLTPKAAARVIRFDRARHLLAGQVAAGGRPRLADLAVTCGYFDQAHLARDFRALAGVPPSQWLAEVFRNVQAAAGGFAADWAQ